MHVTSPFSIQDIDTYKLQHGSQSIDFTPVVEIEILAVFFYSHGHRFRDRTLFWDSEYLCHFSTKMAEIWSPGTFSKGVWTHKISALYLLYFQSYETFSDVFSDFH